MRRIQAAGPAPSVAGTSRASSVASGKPRTCLSAPVGSRLRAPGRAASRSYERRSPGRTGVGGRGGSQEHVGCVLAGQASAGTELQSGPGTAYPAHVVKIAVAWGLQEMPVLGFHGEPGLECLSIRLHPAKDTLNTVAAGKRPSMGAGRGTVWRAWGEPPPCSLAPWTEWLGSWAFLSLLRGHTLPAG